MISRDELVALVQAGKRSRLRRLLPEGQFRLAARDPEEQAAVSAMFDQVKDSLGAPPVIEVPAIEVPELPPDPFR
jgi:hypothetical protein